MRRKAQRCFAMFREVTQHYASNINDVSLVSLVSLVTVSCVEGSTPARSNWRRQLTCILPFIISSSKEKQRETGRKRLRRSVFPRVIHRSKEGQSGTWGVVRCARYSLTSASNPVTAPSATDRWQRHQRGARLHWGLKPHRPGPSPNYGRCPVRPPAWNRQPVIFAQLGLLPTIRSKTSNWNSP
jgi:hypothetical protein